jgi:hypothetical protein
MSIRIVFVSLFSAALLSSCSSATPSDVRPEVAQPLKEVSHLVRAVRPDRAAIMAKLNQAESVPNLNSDERHQIVLAKRDIRVLIGPGIPVGADSGEPQRDTMPSNNVLNNSGPLR